MKCNVGAIDRLLRLFAGTLLVAWAVAGGPWWAYIGLVLLATAAWRFCPLYTMLRVSTDRKGQKRP
jgi:hypothetical protein